MSRRRFTRTLLQLQAAALAACAALASGAAASSTAPSSQTGSAVFTDPAGDAQGGPDVRQVAVTGDAATGSLTFIVTAANYLPATPDLLERGVEVWLDTDMNRATGDPADGTEYALLAWNDPTGRWWNVQRWTGTEWDSVSQSSSMSFTRTGDALTWAVSSNDIGGATRFRFYVFAGTWNETTEQYDTSDDAPDQGFWSFDSATSSQPTPPPPKADVDLLVRAPSTTPKAPQAGRPFTVRFPVEFMKTKTSTVIDVVTGNERTVMSVAWEPATGGTITCTASVGRKIVARCGPFKRDVARVSLVVPKNAAGKLLKIEVRISGTEKETGKKDGARRVVTFRVK